MKVEQNIEQAIREIEDSINYTSITLNLANHIESASELLFYNIDNFYPLLKTIHEKFGNEADFNKQIKLLEDDLLIYKALSQCIKKSIKVISSNNFQLSIISTEDTASFTSGLLDKLYESMDKNISLAEKAKFHIIKKLQEQLRETNQTIFFLKNYHFPTYKMEDFLDNNFTLRFKKEVIIYENVSLGYSRRGYSILYKDESQNITKDNLRDVLAFLQCAPNFILTSNNSYNSKLSRLYSEFDVLDLLRLREKRFFTSPKEKSISIEIPIFKLEKDFKVTLLPKCNHPELFSLYHASLKQIEPLPRCVFLYRILEYANVNHYQKIFRPTQVDINKTIEYYCDKSLVHRFIPLFFINHGTYWHEKDSDFVRRGAPKLLNLLSELKNESKKIKKEWMIHPFLKSKTIGEIIYNTGRNTVAHGGNGRHNTNYDYANKYKHINDVNIFLELIARYIIEILNPQYAEIIHKQRKIYELNSIFFRAEKNTEEN